MRPRLVALLALAAAPFVVQPAAQDKQPAEEQAVSFLERRCIECHGKTEPAGELPLIDFTDGTSPLDDVATWRRVRNELRAGRMPPKKRPPPPHDELDAALRWIDAQIAAHAAPIDPGRVTLRRLNAREYANTIRDLVGVRFDAASFFPTDDVGHGFDDIGDVLSMPDVLVEKYAAAAERIAREAIAVADPKHPPQLRLDPIAGSKGMKQERGLWALYSNGDVHGDADVATAGEYLLRARAWAQQAGPDPARMEFRIADQKVARFDVLAKEDAPELYEFRMRLEPGRANFAAAFVNDYYNKDDPDPHSRDRNLYVEAIEIAGPVGALSPSDFQKQFVASDADPRELVSKLASRAWRRPASNADVERLLALSPNDAPRELVLRNALEALLVSPRFLFLVESDPSDAKPGAVRELDDFEFATRLSYFLWSSMPDDELFELAGAGKLRADDVLDAQVRRMLRDARASALTQGFAAQWLQLGSLERAAPDPQRFEDFDDDLRAAMRAETEMLFETVLREDRPLHELIDPDFTFANARLAKHYGLSGVDSPLMQRVRLDATARETRGGLLAQASVLTVTSNPTRTSPVKRGKWILDNVLGQPPPPPLPGVDNLDESPQAARSASLRERLAQHRADPKCAVCHERMDQLGFALEGFDPVGRQRASADGFPIDASGELDGAHFNGVGDLKRALAGNPLFTRAVTRKLATYALGRGLREQDEPAIDDLIASLGREPTFADLIAGVVRLDAFRLRVVGG